MKYTIALSAALGFASLTGCSQSSDVDSPGDGRFVEAGVIQFAPFDVTTTPRTREQKLASMKMTQQAQEALSVVFIDADPADVPTLHRRLQEVLGGLDGVVRARAEQLAASAMLRVALDPAPDTDETRGIAAVYTQYLVSRKSPQSDLVLDGLTETGEAWTPAQRRLAAAGAVEAAEHSHAMVTAARAARQGAAGARPAPVTDAAVERLRAIAEGAE